jgi:hypothetical protein
MFKAITANVRKLFSETQEVEKTPLQEMVETAEDAWPLTEDALTSSGIPEVADRCHGRRTRSFRQSPLHRIMNIAHTSVDLKLRHQLEDSKEFNQAVAHVFSRVSRESVRRWADAHVGPGYGYYEPLVGVCEYALNKQLVGLSPSIVWEETSTGEIGIYEYPV